MLIRSYTFKTFQKENEDNSDSNDSLSTSKVKFPSINYHCSGLEKTNNLKNTEIFANSFPSNESQKNRKNVKHSAYNLIKKTRNLAKLHSKNNESKMISPNFLLEAKKIKTEKNNLPNQKSEFSFQRSNLLNQVNKISNGPRLLEQLEQLEQRESFKMLYINRVNRKNRDINYISETMLPKIFHENNQIINSQKVSIINEMDHIFQKDSTWNLKNSDKSGYQASFQCFRQESRPEILLIDEFKSSFSPSSEKDIAHPKIEDIIQTSTMNIDSSEKLGIENKQDSFDQVPLAEKLIKTVEDIEFLEKYEFNLENKVLNHKNDSLVIKNIHRPCAPENPKIINNSFGIFPNSFQDNDESLPMFHMKKWKKEKTVNHKITSCI